jgi:Protein kinase domain
VDSLKPGDPRKIGDYLLYGRLGAGGMGEVFFGRSPGGRAVAVKLIHSRYTHDTEFRKRFRREIEACQRVSQFHTAPVLEADPDADRPWMVTAYVPGPSLDKVLAAYPTLPLPSLKVLGAGLAEALKAIHDAGIIHRDLKPSNILLADDGPRVIDFGIARAVDASAATAQHGTPGFVAPEILKRESAESVTSACDVFALGVVLAFAGGVRPFGRGPAEAIAYRVVHEDPHLDELDPDIRGLVAECLARDPQDRPTPSEILGRLGEHDSLSRWLPEPVHRMITESRPPSEPAAPDEGLPEYSRLLAEAEQVARALPDEWEQATALVHIATAAYRIDPPHGARLLSDAWRGPHVEYLIESSPVEVGTAMGQAGPVLGDRMLAGITEYSRVHTHRRMGSEQETARIITAIAEAAAGASPGRGDQLAHLLTDESLRSIAVARVAMAVARADPGRAEQMARAIVGRIEAATRPGAGPLDASLAPRWGRRRARAAPSAPSPETRLGDETARYWAALALAQVALGVAGVASARDGGSPTDPGQFASTITVDGGPWFWAPPPPRSQADIDRAHAAQCLADAERLASGIAASGFTASGIASADLRARAITAVKTAAAQIDYGRADALLLDAEQAARVISADADRLESLRLVALTAAHVDPGRAEQIAGSLLARPERQGELALTVAVRDLPRAERIAATITDEYVRALVRAALMVQAAPGNAAARLAEAEQAAGEAPARLIAVAMMTARTDPVRAEVIARAIKSGPEYIVTRPEDSHYEQSAAAGYLPPAEYNMRSAGYWRARALAGLAFVAYEKSGYLP